jgi:hypothetical protein
VLNPYYGLGVPSFASPESEVISIVKGQADFVRRQYTLGRKEDQLEKHKEDAKTCKKNH